MAKLFDIYYGRGGGFGGAVFDGTFEFQNLEEAVNYAYMKAIEEYESYGGCHGLLDIEEVRQDCIDSFGKEPSEEDLEDAYREQVESWIVYEAKEHIG